MTKSLCNIFVNSKSSCCWSDQELVAGAIACKKSLSGSGLYACFSVRARVVDLRLH